MWCRLEADQRGRCSSSSTGALTPEHSRCDATCFLHVCAPARRGRYFHGTNSWPCVGSCIPTAQSRARTFGSLCPRSRGPASVQGTCWGGRCVPDRGRPALARRAAPFLPAMYAAQENACFLPVCAPVRRGRDSHGTNSWPCVGSCIPTAQSRAGRPRSGIPPETGVVPRTRAYCPRTARSAVPLRDGCSMGKRLLAACPCPAPEVEASILSSQPRLSETLG